MNDSKDKKEESFSFPQSFDSEDFTPEKFHESGGVIFRKTPSLEINTPSFFAKDEETITAAPSSSKKLCDDVVTPLVQDKNDADTLKSERSDKEDKNKLKTKRGQFFTKI